MSMPKAARAATLAVVIGASSSSAETKPDLSSVLDQPGVVLLTDTQLTQYTAPIKDTGHVPNPTDEVIQNIMPDIGTNPAHQYFTTRYRNLID